MALASLRPLRSRNFALIWSAALVSNVGSWMQTVALGVLVYARTDRPAWAGFVAAAGFLPIGLLAPVGGALADRLDRRRWLLATTCAETAFAALLALLAGVGWDPPMVLVTLSFLGGAAGAIGFPAYQAMVPDLVPTEDLLGAVSLSSAQFNLGRVVGPALAGVALLSHDYAVVFGTNAVSFGAVFVALLLVRLPPPAAAQGRLDLPGRIRSGFRSARGEPGCWCAIGLIAAVAFTASPFIALVPAMAGTLVAHGGAVAKGPATALLVTAQGVGAVIGALALPSLAERFGRPRMLRIGLFCLPLTLTAYAVAPTLFLAVAAFAVVGATYIVVLSGLNTVVQLRAPVDVRGRVLGVYMMALGILYPLGAVVQGSVADRLGTRAVTVLGAAALLVALSAVAVVRPAVFRALRTGNEPRPRSATAAPAAPVPVPNAELRT